MTILFVFHMDPAVVKSVYPKRRGPLHTSPLAKL